MTRPESLVQKDAQIKYRLYFLRCGPSIILGYYSSCTSSFWLSFKFSFIRSRRRRHLKDDQKISNSSHSSLRIAICTGQNKKFRCPNGDEWSASLFSIYCELLLGDCHMCGIRNKVCASGCKNCCTEFIKRKILFLF